jgi:hypothetical protein
MLLSAAEYDFELQYLPGVRNIIADYGTRQIDLSEWDKPREDDPEGLHDLMIFTGGDPVDLFFFSQR